MSANPQAISAVAASAAASFCTLPASTSSVPASLVAQCAGSCGECANSSASESGVVAVDHAAFLVHFNREAKLVKTVGEARDLIKAVYLHLTINDAFGVSDAYGLDAVSVAKRAFKRGLDRGFDLAVIFGSDGIWNKAGGLDHEALSPAHRQVFRYIALYLRKCADRQAA